MTGNQGWSDQGLGETGEVYLAGDDFLMRSVSRLLVEHPDDYVATVIANGTPVDVANRIVQVERHGAAATDGLLRGAARPCRADQAPR